MRLPDFSSTCTLALVDRPVRAAHPGGVLAPSDLLSTVRDALQGRYAVAGELGRGGMAVVCRATDLRHGREVAIKVLLPELARAVTGDRFLREISILARLSHPSILPLLDSGTVEVVPGLEVPWYVMPYVAEDTLRARLEREGPLPVDEALHLTQELCGALTHAHRQGIVHRDIKPENILLSGGRAVLADFGIARAVTLSGTSSLSSTGLVIGTPAYMSPEQSAGSERLDARSDLYSLGVVLYEMLAGQPPFTGATPQAISARHQFEAPPPIRVVRPTIPAGVEAVLSRVLEKVPADRYESAEALGRALEGADRSIGVPAVTRNLPHGSRHFRRAPWVVAAGLLLAIFGVFYLRQDVAHRVAIDPEKYIVLPFRTKGTVRAGELSGEDVQGLVSHGLRRWSDLHQVDPLLAEEALRRTGPPTTLAAARQMAADLGAGLVVWGGLTSLADSTFVEASTYRSRGEPGPVASARIGLAGLAADGTDRLGALVFTRFQDLVRQLVLADLGLHEIEGSIDATPSYRALRAFLDGQAAGRRWQLDTAAAAYRRAIAADPGFIRPKLELARLGLWTGAPPVEWETFAREAVFSAGRLAPRDQADAEALLGLATGTYPAACQAYRSLLAADSADFGAWFGLAECLTSDPTVTGDPNRPTTLAYRTSYHEGINAYRRALDLVPSAHRAFGGAALERLAGRLYTASDRARLGLLESDTLTVFVAFPELIADTLAFRPFPIAAAAEGAAAPATRWQALVTGRAILLDITSRWIEVHPQSQAAIRSQAFALELAGHLRAAERAQSAVTLVGELRAQATTAQARVKGALWALRLWLKLGEVDAVRALADSLLADPSVVPGNEGALAGVAALRGRADQAAWLAGVAAERVPLYDLETRPLLPPISIRRDSAKLLVYAAFGDNGDSVPVLGARLSDAIDRLVPQADRATVRLAAFERARLLAFPRLGAPRFKSRLSTAMSAFLEGDTAVARATIRAEVDLQQQLPGFELSPEVTLAEVGVLAGLGDSAAAQRLIVGSVTDLSARTDLSIEDVPPTVALLRLARLARDARLTPARAADDLTRLWDR